MRMSVISALLAIVLIISPASAWQWETHSKLAEKVCRDFGCECISEIREGAIAPDKEFKDNINHHCYNLLSPCEPSKYYSCPKKNGCPALEKMNLWIAESRNKADCARWRDIGIASHYFFDSKVFWHKVQDEDYTKCHELFEGKVEKKFDENDGSNWIIEACGAEENYTDMMQYVSDFEVILSEKSGDVKVQDTPLLPECGWWCRLWNRIASVMGF